MELGDCDVTLCVRPMGQPYHHVAIDRALHASMTVLCSVADVGFNVGSAGCVSDTSAV